MKKIKEVVRIKNESIDYSLGFDIQVYNTENNKGKSLMNFITEIRVIQTLKKWDTWARTYVEVPPHVLAHFGIIASSPITFYLNFVYSKPLKFMYMGSIFSGDAAWFDEYIELDPRIKEDLTTIENSGSFKIAESALIYQAQYCEMETTNTFLDWIHDPQHKWSVVPVNNTPPIGPQGKEAVVYYCVNF